MKAANKYLLIGVAVVIGEVVLVLLSSLVQAVIYHGIYWSSSPLQDIVIGGFLTILTAVVSGYAAMRIARNSYVPHIILSMLVLTETTWLIVAHKTPDPAWFDALAGFSLVVGIWFGGWLVRRRMLRITTV